jgi:DNA-binding NarL/FixJ family response regulator
LYLALEETPARTTRRLRKLKPQPNFLCDITFVYADEMQPALSGGIDQIAEYLEKHPATRLVVIDTLLAFQQRERKASTDIVQSDYNLIRPLQDLATQHDVAVVLVDHSRKMAGAAIDVVSGTTGKTAALDSVMSLQRQTDGTSLLTILSREMDETVYQLKIDSGDDGAHPFGWRILAEGEEAVASAERKEVIELLRDEASGLTSKEIARQTGRKEGATRMLLKRMADRGQVMRLDDNGKWRLL